MKSLTLSSICLLFHLTGWTQIQNLPKKYHPLSINLTFGAQIPAADLAPRFGSTIGIGGGLEYARIPSGWVFGLDFQYFFGKKVKEDVLAKIRTADGFILSDINTYADVELRMRGLYIGANGGKIFKFHDNGNFFGGLRLSLGAGWLYHRIRIQDNQSNAPSLEPVYARGYDRFSAGIATNQFVGYQLISRDRTFNFFVGFDFTEGFTKNRRGFNFDTAMRDDKNRIDILYGVRVGWQLAIFTNQSGDDIEY